MPVPEGYDQSWPDRMGVDDHLEPLDLAGHYKTLSEIAKQHHTTLKGQREALQTAHRDMWEAGRCLAKAKRECARSIEKHRYWRSVWEKEGLTVLTHEKKNKVFTKQISDDMIKAYVRVEKGNELIALNTERQKAEQGLMEWENLYRSLERRCYALTALVDKDGHP